MTGDASARPDGDPRFTIGLVLDVLRVLEDHGYPQVSGGRDLVELQQHLLCFLHGRESGQLGCYGGAR